MAKNTVIFDHKGEPVNSGKGNSAEPLPIEVQALIESRFNSAICQFKERNQVKFEELSRKANRPWKAMSAFWFFVSLLMWLYTPEHIEKHVADKFTDPEIRKSADRIIEGKATAFIEDRMKPLNEQADKLENQIKKIEKQSALLTLAQSRIKYTFFTNPDRYEIKTEGRFDQEFLNQAATPLSILDQNNILLVDLGNTKVSDITPLISLKNIQRLNLYGTKVSDISTLSSSKNLQHLNLYGIKVSDLSPLSSLKKLQHLSLGTTKVSDVSPLSSLENLQFLNLSRTMISDVKPLSTVKNLKELYLNNTQVSDLSPLSSLKKLQSLGLSNTKVSDVNPLSSLSNLKDLSLKDTGVSDISPLSLLKNLQSLQLDNTKVSDVSPLSSLKYLDTLYLVGTDVKSGLDLLRKDIPNLNIVQK